MADSITSRLLRQFGLTGSGAASSTMIPTPKSPMAIDAYSRRYEEAGAVTNPDIWQKYSLAMRRPVTYDSMLQLWDEMSGWDLMAAAMVEIVEEATQTDDTTPHPIFYECNDSQFEEDLNNMLLKLDADSLVPSQVWYTAGFGNSFEKLDYDKGEGVTGMTFAHPMEVRRYWMERNRQCIGFRWAGRNPDKTAAYSHADGATIDRAAVNSDSGKTEPLWYPWDFLHFRRLYRMRFTEHGEPIFDEAQGIYKKLRMAIDQMVVHRAQIQPDRYVVNVDVAELPPRDQMMMVQRWKQSLRSKLSFGSGDSSAPDEFKAIYNPWALDTVLWMAKPKGFTHSIERLAGTSVVPDVYDIELLQNLFFSILGMPKWWVMGQTGQASAPSGKALLASDIRFLRKVKAIQKPIKHGYTWLGYFHALLKGKDISQLDIQAKMPPVGSLEDQAKVETLKAQTEVLAAMGEVMNTYGLPREAWIDVIFKQYMHLPDDVVNVFLTALPPESEGGQMESIKESKAYRHNSTRVVLDEIERQYGKQHPSIQGAVRRIHSALDGKIAPENSTQFKTVESVLGISASSKTVVQLLEGKPDYIRSSYQRDEAPLAKSPAEMQQIHESAAPSGTTAPEGAAGQYYRKWIRPAPRA